MADPYLAYVTSAYAVSALALAGLAVWTHLDGRTAKRRLERLEAERTDKVPRP